MIITMAMPLTRLHNSIRFVIELSTSPRPHDPILTFSSPLPWNTAAYLRHISPFCASLPEIGKNYENINEIGRNV
jgi:hypothetical protein